MQTSISHWIHLYQFLAGIKHQLLVTFFGYSAHCKQHPTCSRYLEEQLKTHGTIVGLRRSFLRIISCW